MSALQQFQYVPAATGPAVTITVSGKTVTASATVDGATSWLWNFGDGTTSTARVPPPKTYPGLGPYTITLKTTYTTADGCRQYDALTIRTVTQPPAVIGFHAPLSSNDLDIITPIANSLPLGGPNYIDGWCRLSGDSQRILYRPTASGFPENAKLSAAAYPGKVTYKCRMRKGLTPSITGSATYRFFYVYNDFGYAGFLIGNSGMVKYVDYRLFPDPPLTNTYEAFIASGPDSVYEMRYEAGSEYMTFYVDDVLVYTSLFEDRLVGNGIAVATPDSKFDFMEFKDCMMVIGG